MNGDGNVIVADRFTGKVALKLDQGKLILLLILLLQDKRNNRSYLNFRRPLMPYQKVLSDGIQGILLLLLLLLLQPLLLLQDEKNKRRYVNFRRPPLLFQKVLSHEI